MTQGQDWYRADADTWIIALVITAGPLIYNERQLRFALTQFYQSRDELDIQARNNVPSDHSNQAAYLADKSELRVLLRDLCLRSTIAASTADKRELVRHL